MGELLLAACAAIFAGSFIWCVISGKLAARAMVLKRLTPIKTMIRRENTPDQDDKRSFFERIIVPMLDHLIRSVATIIPLNEAARNRMNKQLMMAGSRFQAKDYAAITVISGVCLGLIVPLIAENLLGLQLGIAGMAFGVYLGVVVRRFSLASTIRVRKEAIECQLPNIIDLLSVSVTAGLGFEQALNYVTERCEGVLVDELKVVQQQILMGRSRREAMRGLADRCEVDEVATFVSSVLQAEEVGISMQNILNSQSQSVRQAHKQRVEEKAAKLPVKILIPIVFFIFPVIFIVLMGPAVLSAFNTMW